MKIVQKVEEDSMLSIFKFSEVTQKMFGKKIIVEEDRLIYTSSINSEKQIYYFNSRFEFPLNFFSIEKFSDEIVYEAYVFDNFLNMMAFYQVYSSRITFNNSVFLINSYKLLNELIIYLNSLQQLKKVNLIYPNTLYGKCMDIKIGFELALKFKTYKLYPMENKISIEYKNNRIDYFPESLSLSRIKKDFTFKSIVSIRTYKAPKNHINFYNLINS